MDAPPGQATLVTAFVTVLVLAVAAVLATAIRRCVLPPVGRSFEEARSSRSPRPSQARGDSASARLGRFLRAPFDPVPDPAIDRWFGRGVMIVLVAAIVAPALGAGLLMVVVARPVMLRRAVTRASRNALAAQLPQVVDLYAVALRSGHNVATSTAEVVKWGQGPIIAALRQCLDQNAQGEPLSDALEELPDVVGEAVRPLVRVLIASERDGVSIIDPLAVLAADLRLKRRRDAEITARRIPIAMLFPLVVCILPAFMLLTVVPTLVDALSSLDT